MIQGLQALRFSGVYHIESCQVINKFTRLPEYDKFELLLPDGRQVKSTQWRKPITFQMFNPLVAALTRLLIPQNHFIDNLSQVTEPEKPFFLVGVDGDKVYLIRNDNQGQHKTLFLERHPLSQQKHSARYEQEICNYAKTHSQLQPVHLKIYQTEGLVFRFEVPDKSDSSQWQELFCYWFERRHP